MVEKCAVLMEKGANSFVVIGGFKFWLLSRYVRANRTLTPQGILALEKAKKNKGYTDLGVRAAFLNFSKGFYRFKVSFLYLESSYSSEIEIPSEECKAHSFEGFVVSKEYVNKIISPSLLALCPPNSISRKIRYHLLGLDSPIHSPKNAQKATVRYLLSYAPEKTLNLIFNPDCQKLLNCVFSAFVAKRSLFSPNLLVYRFLDLYKPSVIAALSRDINLKDGLREALTMLLSNVGFDYQGVKEKDLRNLPRQTPG